MEAPAPALHRVVSVGNGVAGGAGGSAWFSGFPSAGSCQAPPGSSQAAAGVQAW